MNLAYNQHIKSICKQKIREKILVIYSLIFNKINSKLSFFELSISRKRLKTVTEIFLNIADESFFTEEIVNSFLLEVFEVQKQYFEKLKLIKNISESDKNVAFKLSQYKISNENSLIRIILAFQTLICKIDGTKEQLFLSLNLVSNNIDFPKEFENLMFNINDYYAKYSFLIDDDNSKIIAANTFFIEFQHFLSHFSFVIFNSLNKNKINFDVIEKNKERAFIHLKRSSLDLAKILIASYIRTDVQNLKLENDFFDTLINLRDDEVSQIGLVTDIDKRYSLLVQETHIKLF